jgi:hypothetical protein
LPKEYLAAWNEVQMKKRFVHLIVLAGLVVLLAGVGFAQDNDMGPAARVKIPFDFYAGSVSLPAGVYTFDVDPVGHTVTIEQDSTGRAFVLVGTPADPVQAGQPLLTFENQGGEYRLKELQADIGGVEFAPAKVGVLDAHGTH